MIKHIHKAVLSAILVFVRIMRNGSLKLQVSFEEIIKGQTMAECFLTCLQRAQITIMKNGNTRSSECVLGNTEMLNTVLE